MATDSDVDPSVSIDVTDSALARALPEVERFEIPDVWDRDRRYSPKLMTRWLSPSLLAAAGWKGAVALIFEGFADRRETFAGRTGAVLVRPDLIDDLPAADPTKTELQVRPLLPTAKDGSRTVGEDFWFDFVADTGDGFSPTYSVAEMISGPLDPADPDTGSELYERDAVTPFAERLETNELLIMGGDQVYPFASDTEYRDRVIGPFETTARNEDPGRGMVAIPGNHDWYDGLTSFMARFCSEQWMGAWRTSQSRSYWAAQVHPKWWIFGIDIALESTPLDFHQLEYFRAAAQLLTDDQKIIVCLAKPVWHQPEDTMLIRSWKKFRSIEDDHHIEEYEKLNYFLREVLRTREHDRRDQVSLVLSGDKHFYHRYDEAGPDRLPHLTAGGGGAYVSLPYRQPTQVTVPKSFRSDEQRVLSRINGPSAGDTPKGGDLGDTPKGGDLGDTPKGGDLGDTMWPSLQQARYLGSRAPLLILTRNPGFCALLAAIYTLLAWTLRTSWNMDTPGGDVSESVRSVVETLWQSPGFLAIQLVLFVAFMALSKAPQPVRAVNAAGHALLHMITLGVTMALVARLVSPGGSLEPHQWAAIVIAIIAGAWFAWGYWMQHHYGVVPAVALSAGLLFGVFALVVLAAEPGEFSSYIITFGMAQVLAGVAFALYLALAQMVFGDNGNEISVAVREIGFKHFVRMKIDATGELHVYVIGLEKVPHQRVDWRKGYPEVTQRRTQAGRRPERYNRRVIDHFTVG